MKVLIVGGGGREHALAWKLAREAPSLAIIAAPGNPGIASLARCHPVPATDIPGLTRLAQVEGVDLVVIGPEAPLAAGLADALRAAGIAAFGPSAAAARIESSKSFAKRVMRGAGVPTARAESFSDAKAAKSAARRLGAPLVVKASGLASGKGVIVCQTVEEVERAIDLMLRERTFGAAGAEILLEEFMEGEELSLFVVTNGVDAVPMLAVQDHKRLLDGDRGPNTGGMGAYAPVSLATPALVSEIVERIVRPTLGGLRETGSPFSGLLYTGLMVGAAGPRVVEFNCRFGDPETQALLPLMESDLLPLLLASARGEPLAHHTIRWREAAAVTTVVSSRGYPESPQLGDRITLPPRAADGGVEIFHAGTARDSSGELITAGGRVFAVTAVRAEIADAQRASAAAAGAIQFAGRHFRTDIAWRELDRHAGASRD